MILVLRPGVSAGEVAEVLQELEERGCSGRALTLDTNPVVHVTSGRVRRARALRSLEQVIEVVPTSGPRVRREGWRFFPYHFVNWSAFGVALLGVLVFLAGLFPTGIGLEVDYARAPESGLQPWYLRPPLAFVQLFPRSLEGFGWLLFVGLALALFSLPLLDRSRSGMAAGRGVRLVFALVLVMLVGLSVWKGGHA